MEINEIITAVIQIGLPSVICIFFLKRLSIQDEHGFEIMKTMRESIDANTKAVSELILRVEAWINEKMD